MDTKTFNAAMKAAHSREEYILKDIIKRSFTEPGDKLPEKEEFRNISIGTYSTHVYRSYYVQYSWVILADEWVRALAEVIGKSKAIEVCAGLGYLTKWLRTYGVDITASDHQRGHYSRAHDFPETVKKMAAVTAVKKNPDSEFLIICWPPYVENNKHNDISLKVWNRMTSGQTLVYIGEESWGCNASEAFFEKTYDHKIYQPEELADRLYIPSWFGVHDHIAFFKKP